MGLQDEREDLLALLEFEQGRLAAHPPIARLGELCDYLGDLHRANAACCVLLDGDSEAFAAELARSAGVRAHYLRRCAAESGHRDLHLAVSNGPGFFDALAARAFPLATEIAALSPEAWAEDAEYEDDYCFYRFFHLYIRQDPGLHGQLGDLLARFERALEGQPSAGLAICHALLELNQDAFDEAFEDLLDERTAELEQDATLTFNDPIVYHAKRKVFTLGLGVLNVADRAGLRTLPEYRYCPFLCRLPVEPRPPGGVNRAPR